MGQQYLQIYGVPGAVNTTTIYPYGQVGQAIPSGHGYSAIQGYTVPGHQIVPYGGSNVNAITTSPMPAIQASYPSGMVVYPEEFLFMTKDVLFCCLVNLCSTFHMFQFNSWCLNFLVIERVLQFISDL